MSRREVSETRVIATTPETIFALLADPASHPVIDGSGSVLAPRGPAQRLALGSTFGMDMKLGANYKVLNTVVEFEENRLITWRHFAGHRWRWRLLPIDGGRTQVTETFDWSTARYPLLLTLSPFPRRNRVAIRKTLDNLTQMFPAT